MDDVLPGYLPEDRAHALACGVELPGHASGAVLFADISGFTPLTAALASELGAHYGAEELARHLNVVYTAVIGLIHQHGGSVISFSGDAVTCWFDTPASHPDAASQRAVACAWALHQALTALPPCRTPGGQFFTLSLKVAITSGAVCRFLVGDPAYQQLDVLAGATVARLAIAEQHTHRGEIIVDEATIALLRGQVSVTDWRGDLAHGQRFGVLAAAQDVPVAFDDHRSSPSDISHIHTFLPPQVAALLISGSGSLPTELRPAVALFLRFGELDYDADASAAPQLDVYVRWVQRILDRYGGTLLQLTIGDKGSYLYAAFGAPVAHENDSERALRAALDLVQPPPDLARLGSPQIGISRGTMRTGSYGGSGRLTYGVLGDAANTAARLMQAAPAGQILVSATGQQTCMNLFTWKALPPLLLKGKAAPLRAFRLLAAQEQRVPTFYQGALVGRAAELERLAQAAAPIFAGQFAGVCYVDGEPGVGKSRLVYAMRQRLEARGPRTWLYCPSDEILRGSLHPFAHLLRARFDQAAQRSVAENQASFDAALDRLRDALPTDADGPVLAAELDRTRSFLGALVGLHWEGSLYEQLDAQLRFENTLSALATLIKAESLRQPVLLELEDAHWLDDVSRALLTNLSSALVGFPVVIVCAARPNDDGRPARLDIADDTPVCVVDLAALPPDGARVYAEQVLGQPLSDELARFVYERTSGNPFFVEQLLLDLRERGMIDHRPPNDGLALSLEWSFVLRPLSFVEIPDTLNSLLVARLDRLATPVKEVVQTAAVLGREWLLPVLAAMLSDDAELLPKVRAAEDGRVWSPLSERDYLFRHVLLRDAAYSMQARERLCALHRRAAEAVEQEYAENPATQYAALVYHYREAKDHARERHYAKLAGEVAAARYANTEAIAFLSRALELTPEDDLEGRWDLLLARAQIAYRTDDQSMQLADIVTLEQLAASLGDAEHRSEAAFQRSFYAEKVGDLDGAVAAARDAMELARHTSLPHIEAKTGVLLGGVLMRSANYTEARSVLEQSLEICRRHNNRQIEGEVLRQLGRLCSEQGQTEHAVNLLTEALVVHRQINHRFNEAVTLHSLGISADNCGDHFMARNFFEQTLALCREIGYHLLVPVTISSLGLCASRLGDYVHARACCEQALAMHRERGSQAAESYTLINLGYICANQGDYAAAYTYSEQALAAVQALGMRHGEGYAWWGLGNVLLELKQIESATVAYCEAVAVERAIGLEAPAIEAIAGLARVALAQEDLPQACEYAEEMIHYLDGGSLDGMEEPLWIHLTCYRVLHAAHDPRANDILTAAYTLLQDRASRIADEAAQHMFLDNVPHHRALVAAWQALRAAE